jgi:multidrug resistance efflux pump
MRTVFVFCAIALVSGAALQTAAQTTRTVRLTGVIEPRRSVRVVVPQLTGPATRLTLTSLVPHGAVVAEGDVIARFDPVEQFTQERAASAKFEDLSQQVRQKEAENRANSERRRSTFQEAQAELARALLEVSKAEILSDADQKKNALRAERARFQVQSLEKSNKDHDAADSAALRILELQRDRQRVAFERARANIERLELRAPLAGMVAHATTFRSGSMVRPQQGDQLFRNAPLLTIFDPTEMLVRSDAGEPDGALLVPGLEATVYIDAYPDMSLKTYFESASPVASSPLGSPIKTFTAIFRLDRGDRRLMPDLSAAVVFNVPLKPASAGGSGSKP